MMARVEQEEEIPLKEHSHWNGKLLDSATLEEEVIGHSGSCCEEHVGKPQTAPLPAISGMKMKFTH